MSIESRKNTVRAYLASQHMHVDDEWLSGCVEFLTEDSRNNYTETDIKNLAKEQWLLNDLKDICPGSLPANLKNQQKTVLNGRFALQVNAAVDIGTPAYQQYLKLQKVNTENIEATSRADDKIPSHRIIKLYLTDGVQEITAIEYKPMRNLSCDITPGCKALIKGPVECRRGVLLLSEGQIGLLGGEVQEIAITNSLPGLLSAKLGLTLTQEPDLNTSIALRNTNIPTPHTQMPTREDSANARPIARVTSLQVASNFDDDIDIDQIAAIEAQYDHSDQPTKRSRTDFDRPQPRSDSHKSDTHRLDTHRSDTHRSDFETQPQKKIKMDSVNTIDDYPNDDDMFDEDEEYLREMEVKFYAADSEPQSSIEPKCHIGPQSSKIEPKCRINVASNIKESKRNESNLNTFKTYNNPSTSSNNQIHKVYELPQRISSEPFIYIKQINDLSDSEKAGMVFKVKAQIMKLLSKLSVGKDGWSLKCTIVDGTGTLDVDFTSGVLSKLVGYTPQEMNQLKKQMVSKPELKERAVSALQSAREKLQILYSIIELTMLDGAKITNLYPFEDTHVQLLEKRCINR